MVKTTCQRDSSFDVWVPSEPINNTPSVVKNNFKRIKHKLPLPKVAGYEVLELTGEGTFGSTYRLLNIQDKSTVALKVPKSSSTREAIVKEAEMVFLAAGTNVVALLGHVKVPPWPGSAFAEISLLFEFIDYVRFDEFIQTATETQHVWYIQNLLAGLKTIHRHGIIHRDIKPSNVLHDRRLQQFRIIDFGLAQEKHNQSPDRGGTHGFRAPERLVDPTLHVGVAVDLWAAGIIFAGLLTQRHPFVDRRTEELSAVVSMVGSNAMHSLARDCGKRINIPWSQPGLRKAFCIARQQWDQTFPIPFHEVYSTICACLQPVPALRTSLVNVAQERLKHAASTSGSKT
jgi:serine/threonine protein kinase